MDLPTKTLGSTGLNVTVLGLGTVEIGSEYGIGAKNLPDEAAALNILSAAVDAGITLIDTAYSYGVAEERIGMSGIGKKPGIVIATKCGQVLEKGSDIRGEELKKLLRSEVEESLKRLKTDSLQLLQLHFATEEQIKRGEVIEILQKIKDDGLAQHIGISTRGEEAPLAAMESGFFETLQLAHSIVDQRMVSRVMKMATEKNVGIINRSVLLKGSLVPARREKLPDELSVLKEHSRQAEEVANDVGMDLPTLGLRFALSQPAVSSALIGTANVDRIQWMVDAAQQGPLPDDVLEKLYPLGIEDPLQVDANKWPPV